MHILDINECLHNNGGCMHVCKNTVGGFKCECEIGHHLGADRTSCYPGY